MNTRFLSAVVVALVDGCPIADEKTIPGRGQPDFRHRATTYTDGPRVERH